MQILFSWLDPLRTILMFIDSIAFAFLDNAYNVVIELSDARLLNHDKIKNITVSLYVLIGIVAFFRVALVLVNSIIDPEKLNEEGKGLSNIFFRVVGMIILLAVTPFLFDASYYLTSKLVSSKTNDNVIFSIFLSDKMAMGGNQDGEYNAGKALQNIVLSSLITINKDVLVNKGATCRIDDDGVVTTVDGNTGQLSDLTADNSLGCGYVPVKCVPQGDDGQCQNYGGFFPDTSICKGECINAINTYNEDYLNEDMSPLSLSGHANVTAKIDGEDEYVYDYMVIATTAAGVFITFVIVSFGIDIAIRLFELFVLEITSPFFIATFVDPKSSESGPFKNWLSAVGKSYVSLFIKLFILALFTYLLMILNEFNMFNDLDVNGLTQIFVVIGLLIFVKKAPKWINELLGIKDGGMGGLWTPKNLAAGMLGAGMMTKAARGAVGGGLAAGKNIAALARNRRANKRDYKKALEDDRKSFIASKMADLKRKNPNMTSQEARTLAQRAYEQEQKQRAKALKKDFNLNAGSSALQVGSALFNAAGSFNAAAKGDKLSSALKTANDRSNAYIGSKGLRGDSIISKAKDKVTGIGADINDAAFGNAYQRKERIEAIEKAKNEREWHKDGVGINSKKAFAEAIEIKGGKIAANEEDAFVVMGAKKAGISADAIAYDANGNLTINGAAISDKDKNSYINKIADNLTDSGFAHYAEMYNGVQTNSLNEYQSNMQQMQQMSSVMSSLQDSISKTFGKFESNFGDIVKKGFSLNASDGSLNVKLDDGSIKKITKDNYKSEGFDKDTAERLESFFGDSEYSNLPTFIQQYNQNSVNLSAYSDRQEQLAPIIQGAKFIVDPSTGRMKRDSEGNPVVDNNAATLSGMESKFARETSKIKEKIEFIEKKQKDDNKSGS